MIVVALSVGAVLAPILLYYFLSYRPANERYFTASRFRALGVLAEQIEGGIQSRYEAVKSAAAGSPDPIEALHLDPLYMDATDRHCEGATRAQCKPAAAVAKARTPHEAAYSCVIVEPNAAPAPRGTTSPQFITAAGEDADVEKSNATAYFRYDCTEQTQDAPCTKVCAAASLSRILSPFIEDADISTPAIGGSPVEGEDLFVADRHGQILFERGDPGIRLAAIPTAKPVVAGKDDSKAAPTPTAAITSQAAAENDFPTIDALTATSRLHEIHRANAAYMLFTHPLHVPGDVWVVGVLVPSSRFRSDVSRLSLGSLGYVPLLVLLGALLGPLLKVATMGRRDRLSASDVRILVIGSVLAVGIVTAVILGSYAYWGFEDSVDAEAEGISKRLRDAFHLDLERAYAALQLFASERAGTRARLVEHGTDESRGNAGVVASRLKLSFLQYRVTNISTAPQHFVGNQRNNSDCLGSAKAAGFDATVCTLADDSLITRLMQIDPYLRFLLWTDKHGQQWEKWTIEDETTPFIDSNRFNIFKDAHDKRLWTLDLESSPTLIGPPRPPPRPVGRIAVHSLLSPTTAEVLPTVSIPMDGDHGLLGVAMLVPHVVSFIRPVLPPGFGFAVIQNDGQVVFHSNRQRNLYENFFEECENPRPLRAIIEARQAQVLELRYHARRQRAYVHPIEDTSWSLIVFRDKELDRTQDLDILMTWFVLFVVYVSPLVLVWALVRWLVSRHDTSWIWPDPDRWRSYAACAAVLALIGISFVWILARHSGESGVLLTICISMSVVSVAYTFLQLTGRPAGTPSQSDEGRRFRRAFACVALIAAIGLAIAACVASSDGLAIAVLVAVVSIMALALSPDTTTLPPTLSERLARSWAAAYVVVGLLLLGIVGIVPSSVLYVDAFQEGMEVFARHKQLRLAEELSDREFRLRYHFGKFWSDDLLKQRLRESGDCPACGSSAPSDSVAVEPQDRFCGPVPSRGAKLVMEWLPVYHTESVQLREFVHDAACDQRWRCERCTDGKDLLLTDTMLTNGDPSGAPVQLRVRYTTPSLPRPAPVLMWSALGLIPMLAVGAYHLLAWLVDQLFGVKQSLGSGSPPLAAVDDREAEVRGALWIGPPPGVLSELRRDAYEIDLQTVAPPFAWQLSRARAAQQPVVLVNHLEYRFDSAEWNRAKLALLEDLVLGSSKCVLVVSQIDPLVYLRDRYRSPGDQADERYITPEEIDRWARVLERVVRITAATPPIATVPSAVDLRVLAAECSATPRLRQIGNAMRWTSFNSTCPDAIIEQIRDIARAHYRSLWSLLTDEERLVLIHLAKEGFVNPRNWRTVGRLMNKGLIRRTPALHVMNESFRRFVTNEESDKQVKDWEHASGASPWSTARSIILSVAIVGGVFFALTQPEVLSRWVGALTAVGGATATVANLFGFFRGARPAPAVTSRS